MGQALVFGLVFSFLFLISHNGGLILSDLNQLQKSLGIDFRDLSLLKLALIHSSFINENPDIAQVPYERLEFLGDAVLGLVIAEKLYQDLPGAPEGEMTQLRAALVRREMLANLAQQINLGEYLYLGIGEQAGGGRQKPINLAGAFEAVIAAIYLDQGLETARVFILQRFGPQMHIQADQMAGTNYKSRLQEIMQAERQITPSYQVVESSGPDHDRLFVIDVKVFDEVLGRGSGKSKKAAETEAARAALEHLANR
jgi:ribonuclease III